MITHAEELLSLAEAAVRLPRINGRKPHTATLWRWCRRGCRGTRLEYVRIGCKIATSTEALDRFFNALAAADTALGADASMTAPRRKSRLRTPKARQRAIEVAQHAALLDAGDAIAESTAALAGALLSVDPIFSESCVSKIG